MQFIEQVVSHTKKLNKHTLKFVCRNDVLHNMKGPLQETIVQGICIPKTRIKLLVKC